MLNAPPLAMRSHETPPVMGAQRGVRNRLTPLESNIVRCTRNPGGGIMCVRLIRFWANVAAGSCWIGRIKGFFNATKHTILLFPAIASGATHIEISNGKAQRRERYVKTFLIPPDKL